MQCIPQTRYGQEAEEYAQSLLALAPMAVTSMLEIIGQLEAGELDKDHARALAEACSDSEDVQEVLRLSERSARRASTIGDPDAIAATMLGFKKIQAFRFLCP